MDSRDLCITFVLILAVCKSILNLERFQKQTPNKCVRSIYFTLRRNDDRWCRNVSQGRPLERKEKVAP